MIKSPFTTKELNALQTITEQAPLIRAIKQLKDKIQELEQELKSASEESDQVNLLTFQNLTQELRDLEEKINSLKLQKGDKGDTVVGPPGPKGDKGDTTIVEKVIEIQKTEVIREIPIVTENVVEKAIPESAEAIKEKLALDALFDELRKEFEMKLQEKVQSLGTRGFGGIPGLLTYVDGSKKGFLKGANFKAGTGVTLSHSIVNSLDTITFNASAITTVYSETPSGLINGSNITYTTLHSITTVYGFWINGEFIHPAEYSASGTTITFVTALPIDLSGKSFTIVYA